MPEARNQIATLDGAEVVSISRADASGIILPYEYLGTLGRGASAFYGLVQHGELLGATVFSAGPSPEGRNLCGIDYADRAICLMRGACVPWRPPNSGSYLVRRACRAAFDDHGWSIFFAYADETAGEIGTIYQACGWHYLGQGLGRRHGAVHLNWRGRDGRLITSHNRKMRCKRKMFLLGYRPEPSIPKRRYAWFEDRSLAALCKYPPLPYPKRTAAIAERR